MLNAIRFGDALYVLFMFPWEWVLYLCPTRVFVLWRTTIFEDTAVLGSIFHVPGTE